MRGDYTYVMSNVTRTALYVGVTNDIRRRTSEHQEGTGSAFTKKYRCKYLLYYEWFDKITDAIAREKQLKNWKREWKLNLIRETNPKLRDLSNDI